MTTLGGASWSTLLDCSVEDLAFFSTFSAFSTADQRYFLKYAESCYFFFNQSNVPIHFQTWTARTTKNIPYASYTTFPALFSANAPSMSSVAFDPLTGPDARDYMKFGPLRTRIIMPGRVWKICMRKYYSSPKQIKSEFFMNPNFLSIVGARYLFFRFRCIALEGTTPVGATGWPTGTVSYYTQDQIKYYIDSVNTISSTAGSSFTQPSAFAHTYTAVIPQTLSTGP